MRAGTQTKEKIHIERLHLPTSKEKTPGTAPSRMEAEEVRKKEIFMLFYSSWFVRPQGFYHLSYFYDHSNVLVCGSRGSDIKSG